MAHPAVAATPRIHPTALIEEGVEIGARTAVWDNVHVRGPDSFAQSTVHLKRPSVDGLHRFSVMASSQNNKGGDRPP